MRIRARKPCTLGLVALMAVWPSVSVHAQHTDGRIGGIVRDATDAALAGVQMDAVEITSGRLWHTATDERGSYVFAALHPGSYQVTARHDGFRTAVAASLDLAVNQVVRLDIRLEVGPVSESIQVTADRPPLQPESTTVSTTISAREAVSLPVNGRNFISLTLLAPGVVSPALAGWATGQRTTGGGRPYVNGNRKEANNFLLDGVDANQTTDNLLAYQPSLDAIQEVQLITNNAPAEYGNYQGAIVNVTLKSGSNQLHGSLFEFFRDEALNAASWEGGYQPVDALNPRRKSPFRNDVFGGTGGGPVVRNKMFVFGDYQGTRTRSGRTTSLLTLVTTAMRRGDFSALLAGPHPQQLYDPFTTRPDPRDPTRFVRDPFPNNQIPLDRINPVPAALFSSRLYPEPALPGLMSNTFNTTSGTLDNGQFDVKLDAKSGTHDLSARYAHGMQTTGGRNSQPLVLTNGTRSPFRAGLAHWGQALGPSLFNEARVGFNRIVLVLDGGADSASLGAFGEAIGIAAANRRSQGLPAISLAGAGTIGSSRVVQDFTANTFQYQDTLLWRRGTHAVKIGALVLRYEQNVYFSGNSGQLGLIEFNGQYTRDLTDPRSLGSGIADFFLGYPSHLARGDFAEMWQQRSTLWAGFLQDDWRASRNLTANLGLRYEYRTPLVEVHDRQVNFDLATGRALFAGRNGNSRGLYQGYKWDFQPRLGIAWTPERWRQRVVVRGAYSVSSYQEGTGTNLRLTLNPPYFNEFETINQDPTVLGAPINAGFDALREKDPLIGTILRAWDPKLRPARVQQWNVTTERQLGRSIAVTAGYIGQSGTGLVVPVNADQVERAGQPRPLDAIYPQISGLVLTTPNANQRYDALQATGRKRFSDGWEIVGAYTWSLGMSHGRGFFSEGGQTAEPASFWPNPRDRDAEWGPVPFDVRHNVTVAGLWDLPWGRGRRWLNSGPAWLTAAAGGWSIAAIWKAHTGFPITITGPDQSQTGARSARPDQIGSGEGPREVGPGHLWFDTSAFVLPKLGTFGNARVGSIRGPGLNVVDSSATKRTHLMGRSTLDLRADVFNVFNIPQFNAPDRSLTSSTFGRVLFAQLAREVQLSVKLSF